MRAIPKAVVLAALVAGSAAMTGCGSETADPGAAPTPAADALRSAQEGCASQVTRANDAADAAGHLPAVDLSEDGRTMVIVTGDGSADGSSPSFRAVTCLLEELGASTGLVDEVNMTSSTTEEEHTASESGLDYVWHYESDSGLNMTIREG